MMDDLAVLPPLPSSQERRRSSRFRSTSRTFSETPERSTHSTPITSLQDTPQDEKLSVRDESPVPQRKLRQRKSLPSNGTAPDPVEEAMKPLTDEERQHWKGWVELESDPVSTLSSCFSTSRKHVLQLLHSGLIANLRLYSATF
jgi:ubiquitin carboxyl-terminal hydrolase L5